MDAAESVGIHGTHSVLLPLASSGGSCCPGQRTGGITGGVTVVLCFENDKAWTRLCVFLCLSHTFPAKSFL